MNNIRRRRRNGSTDVRRLKEYSRVTSNFLLRFRSCDFNAYTKCVIMISFCFFENKYFPSEICLFCRFRVQSSTCTRCYVFLTRPVVCNFYWTWPETISSRRNRGRARRAGGKKGSDENGIAFSNFTVFYVFPERSRPTVLLWRYYLQGRNFSGKDRAGCCGASVFSICPAIVCCPQARANGRLLHKYQSRIKPALKTIRIRFAIQMRVFVKLSRSNTTTFWKIYIFIRASH